jgi:hypothetical protein
MLLWPGAGVEVVRGGLSAGVSLLDCRRAWELEPSLRVGIFSAEASLRLRRVCAPGGGDRGIAGRMLVSSWLIVVAYSAT